MTISKRLVLLSGLLSFVILILGASTFYLTSGIVKEAYSIKVDALPGTFFSGSINLERAESFANLMRVADSKIFLRL